MWESTDGVTWNKISTGVHETQGIACVNNRPVVYGIDSRLFAPDSSGKWGVWVDLSTVVPNGPYWNIRALHGGEGNQKFNFRNSPSCFNVKNYFQFI